MERAIKMLGVFVIVGCLFGSSAHHTENIENQNGVKFFEEKNATQITSFSEILVPAKESLPRKKGNELHLIVEEEDGTEIKVTRGEKTYFLFTILGFLAKI